MMIRGKLESPRELPQHEIVIGEPFIRRTESGHLIDKDGKVITVEELSLDIYEKYYVPDRRLDLTLVGIGVFLFWACFFSGWWLGFF